MNNDTTTCFFINNSPRDSSIQEGSKAELTKYPHINIFIMLIKLSIHTYQWPYLIDPIHFQGLILRMQFEMDQLVRIIG